MDLTTTDLKMGFLVGLSYLVIATGSVLPIISETGVFSLHTAFIFIVLIVYGSIDGATRPLAISTAIVLPLLMLLIVQLTASSDLTYAFAKIEGGVLSSIIATLLICRVISRSDETKYLTYFITISLIVLVLTIIYRQALGLSGRQGRFLVNGPIVFGWIMGFNAIITLHLILIGRTKFLFILTFIFTVALFWTASKGPIVALTGTVFILSLREIRSYRAWLSVATILGCTWVTFHYILSERLAARFLVFGRVLDGTLTSGDYGSIGSRTDAWYESIEIFEQSPLFGVGLGNWGEYTTSALNYPHNFFFEAISELGIVGLIVLLSTLLFIFLNTSKFGKICMLYFLLAMSFSGDLSYLRFVVSIPIATYICQLYQPARMPIRTY